MRYDARVRRRAGPVALVLTLGCADDETAADGHCGVGASRHLLTLDPGVSPVVLGGAKTRIGDRVYFIVAPDDADGVGHGATTVFSTGGCGGDVRMVAEEIDAVFGDERWPGQVLAERSGVEHGIVILDPRGADPPRLFIAGASRNDRWTDLGIVGMRESQSFANAGHVQLTDYPGSATEGPTRPRVVLDGVVDAANAFAVVGHAVFVLTASERTLRRYDLATGTSADLAAQVAGITTSADGRWLIWQQLPETPDVPAPGYEPKLTYLLDIATGAQTSIGSTVDLVEAGSTYVLTRGNGEYGFPSALVDLPSGETSTLPMFHLLLQGLTPDLFLGTDLAGYGIYDRNARDWVVRFQAEATMRYAEDHLLLRQTTVEDPALGTVLRVDFDVLEPRVVAMRAAHDYRELADGRLLARVGGDEGDSLRELVVVDPVSLEETHLDDDARLIGADWWVDAQDGAVAYYVEREGRIEAWLARP